MTFALPAAEAQALLDATLRGELPDDRGRFGPFGGRYVPETLVPAFERLEQGVREHLHDAGFQAEFQRELREWVGRPTALTHAPRLSEHWGTEVWLKREDLAHTGAPDRKLFKSLQNCSWFKNNEWEKYIQLPNDYIDIKKQYLNINYNNNKNKNKNKNKNDKEHNNNNNSDNNNLQNIKNIKYYGYLKEADILNAEIREALIHSCNIGANDERIVSPFDLNNMSSNKNHSMQNEREEDDIYIGKTEINQNIHSNHKSQKQTQLQSQSQTQSQSQSQQTNKGKPQSQQNTIQNNHQFTKKQPKFNAFGEPEYSSEDS